MKEDVLFAFALYNIIFTIYNLQLQNMKREYNNF